MNQPVGELNTKNHDRDAAGLTYVYPVVSRRAGGVSVGINLNPNNACNWHCAYCQVPNLTRGSAPKINLMQLTDELNRMLDDILVGSFMQLHVPEDARKLCDIAISGNGEPTSCGNFDIIVQTIVAVMKEKDLNIPLRLITNGSYIRKTKVQNGLRIMASHHGELWIKVDAATGAAIRRINGISLDNKQLFDQVATAAKLCPSWIQTCMMAWDGKDPDEKEVSAYLNFLRRLKQEHVPVRGVLLYGLARPSMQPEAVHVSALGHEWMNRMVAYIEEIGWKVKLSL